MKVDDLVRPNIGQSFIIKDAIGVILESRVMVSTSGLSTNQIRLMGKNVNSHHVYWSAPILKNMWVKECDLEKAV